MTLTGKLITLEGADGAGKTTQATRLVERLRAAGLDCILVREPGGTPAGEEIRHIVKSGVERAPRTELLLFEAARAELSEKVVRPALEQGKTVVADRFSDSSLAYQGYGRGLDPAQVHTLTLFATGGIEPDLTVLLDVDVAVGLARSESRDEVASDGTQFEGQPDSFHQRVVEGFRELARREPGRWRVVDGSDTPEAVSEAVWKAIAEAFALS